MSVSGAGTVLCLVALVAGAIAAARRRGARHVGRVLIVVPVAASVLLSQNLFLRPGPPQQPQVGSYPSGHVAVVTALAFGAVLLFREPGRGRRQASGDQPLAHRTVSMFTLRNRSAAGQAAVARRPLRARPDPGVPCNDQVFHRYEPVLCALTSALDTSIDTFIA